MHGRPRPGQVPLQLADEARDGFAGRRRLSVAEWASAGIWTAPRTTLARATYPDLNYINLDAIEQREVVREVRTGEWAASVGPAVLDEAQKEPLVFAKVKCAFDACQLDRTVLLGSSQILMVQRLRETLAGRAFVFELWPLMACEIVSPDGAATPRAPLLDRFLTESGDADALLADAPRVVAGEAAERGVAAIEHLLSRGGLPALLPLSDAERRKWLQSYETTYLERDLGDLARLPDLMPFGQFQRLCALRTRSRPAHDEPSPRLAETGSKPVSVALRPRQVGHRNIQVRPVGRLWRV